VHEAQKRGAALALVEQGFNDCEIARRLGIPRTTVRDWRRPTYFANFDICPRCWLRLRPLAFSDADYAELLGLYLGDGHISTLARTQRLRIFLDSKYTAVVDDAEALLRQCFPNNPVGRALVECVSSRSTVRARNTTARSCSSPGSAASSMRRRGSSCAGASARTAASSSTAPARYEHLSYGFANHSSDILDLFEATCLRQGLRPRRYAQAIRLNRREDVARLIEHVGVKS
jgi:hypothetical protein